MDATSTIVLGVVGTVMGGLMLTVIVMLYRIQADLAGLKSDVRHYGENVKVLFKWRDAEMERRAARRTETRKP